MNLENKINKNKIEKKKDFNHKSIREIIENIPKNSRKFLLASLFALSSFSPILSKAENINTGDKDKKETTIKKVSKEEFNKKIETEGYKIISNENNKKVAEKRTFYYQGEAKKAISGGEFSSKTIEAIKKMNKTIDANELIKKGYVSKDGAQELGLINHNKENVDRIFVEENNNQIENKKEVKEKESLFKGFFGENIFNKDNGHAIGLAKTTFNGEYIDFVFANDYGINESKGYFRIPKGVFFNDLTKGTNHTDPRILEKTLSKYKIDPEDPKNFISEINRANYQE